jgi:glycosyltransferase involved in cell wall biosynthesis
MLKRLVAADPAAISNTVVVSLTSLGVIGESLRHQGVIVHTLQLLPMGFNIISVIGRLIKLIRHYQPDIVQTWMYHADLVGGLAAYFAGYKNIVWSIHRTSLSSSNPIRTLLTMKICAVLSHWLPKKILCVAESARQAHYRAGYDVSRMIVVANGFESAKLTMTREQKTASRLVCRLAEEDMVIGCVGRFHADKGQDNFIKATSIIVKQQPAVKFLLVGRACDNNNSQLITWLKQYNLQEHFVLLGERDDVPVCLAAMDIFCMPSRTEGFPVGLGEAMAMGLPCVATNVGDTAVLTGDTAILVPPQNEQALAQGLLSVLALSEQQREQMGLRAKERVMSEFSIAKTKARFEAIYQEIISTGKA